MKHFLTLSLLAILQVGWAQSEYCLDGTIWDAALGGCVPESDCLLDSDLNGDGVVGTGDLLLLLTEFGGSFPDTDSDGICDDTDDCVGEIDECGVCNGPGPTVPVIESIQILYDSVFLPLDNDWYVFPISADTTFNYTCQTQFLECGDLVNYQGYDYTTVLIGEDCWFAENLNCENYRNGDSIPSDLSDEEWEFSLMGALTLYGEFGDSCFHMVNGIDACDTMQSLSTFGRLYNAMVILDSRGVCPSGWSVPDTAQASGLMSTVESGLELMSTSFWNVLTGTDVSGFDGRPGGYRNFDGGLSPSQPAGNIGAWWLLNESGSDQQYAFILGDEYSSTIPFAAIGEDKKAFGLSIRCIKDSE